MCACVGGDEHVHRLLGPLELLATVEESAVREMVGCLMLFYTKIYHLNPNSSDVSSFSLFLCLLLSCLIPLSWKQNFLFDSFRRGIRQ